METTTFDGITRNLGSSLTRRGALRGLFAGAAAVVAGGAVLHVEDASARRRRKKQPKGGKRTQPQTTNPQPQPAQGLPEGSPCYDDNQCNFSQHLICEIPYGASNSDKACCRGVGATCGPNLHCCTGEAGGREFQCVNGICQPYKEPL